MKAICILEKGFGTILLDEDPITGLTIISGIVRGLTPGKHGIHIHELGNLSNGCETLGCHYNPFGKNHGSLRSKIRHVGDLGNIVANKKGIAKFVIKDKLVKLSGKYSVIGRSIVVHADEDDLGKGSHSDSLVTGHSGNRVTCGVIGRM